MSVEIDKSSNDVVFIAPSCGSKVPVDEKVFLNMLNDLILNGLAYASTSVFVHDFEGYGSVSLKKKQGKVSVRMNITRQGSPSENYNPNDPPTPGGVTFISHDALPFEMEYQRLEEIRDSIIESIPSMAGKVFERVLTLLAKRIFTKDDFQKIIQDLLEEDMPKLKAKLLEFKSERESVNNKKLKDIQKSMDRTKNSSNVISNYYKNDMRAAEKAIGEETLVIDKAIAFLPEISK